MDLIEDDGPPFDPENPVFHRRLYLDQDDYKKALGKQYTPLQFDVFMEDLFAPCSPTYPIVRRAVDAYIKDPLLHLFVTFPGDALAVLFDYFHLSKKDLPVFDANILIWALVYEEIEFDSWDFLGPSPNITHRAKDTSVLCKIRLLDRLGVEFDMDAMPKGCGYGKSSNLQFLGDNAGIFPKTLHYLTEIKGYNATMLKCQHQSGRCDLCEYGMNGYCG